MRRKSTRTSGKQSPDKGKQSDVQMKKTRRTSKRRRKSLSGSENSEEEEDVKQTSETENTSEINTRHNPSDTENNDLTEKAADIPEERMEKPEKKIRLKRSRFSSINDENDTNSDDKNTSRRSRRRGSPMAEERTPQEDEDDNKKGKGKSKSKIKSKIEKSQPPNEFETHNESEISTNAQVTAQSPQIDNTNVVDVAENAEDSKTEIEHRGEGDIDVGAQDKSEINDTLPDTSTNKLDNKDNTVTIENGSNFNDLNESQTSEIENQEVAKNKQEINNDVCQNRTSASPLTTAENRSDGVAVIESVTQINKEIASESAQNEASEEIKSDEGFAGFTADQVTQKKSAEFVEEPMDISMDVTFTLKTDESSRNITEAEETNEDVTVTEEGTNAKNREKSETKSRVHKKISLLRDQNERPVVKRQKSWGSSTTGLNSFTSTPINTAVVQNIYPNVVFLDESEVKLDLETKLETKDRRKSITEPKERKRLERSVSSSDSEYRKYDTKYEEKEQEDNANIIAMNRKISIVDDSASKLKPPPSPARNPLSNVLFITNLVRPFTLKQLKELLERTGKITENGFSTDRIKSKCYVQYEKVEDAEATRNALHGVHWPIGNGKKLIIDYSTPEELENAKNPPVTPPIPPEIVTIEKENEEPPKRIRDEEEEKLRDRLKEKRKHEHVREWDVGKAEVHRDRTRSRERERQEKRRRARFSPSPFDDFITRKQKKAEEQVPQKLMDDLFQKTKTTPSIYWQPLTPEEIATKQQQRLERMAEHKRRLEESTRNRAEFGRGGPYRRRYD